MGVPHNKFYDAHAKLGASQKNRVLWLKLLNVARYKDKKPHFEISVKLRIFKTPYQRISQKKLFYPI
jgi:hypothetical protein